MLITLTLPASSRCFNFVSLSHTGAPFKFRRLVNLFYISSLQATIKSISLNDPFNCPSFLALFSLISVWKYTYSPSTQLQTLHYMYDPSLNSCHLQAGNPPSDSSLQNVSEVNKKQCHLKTRYRNVSRQNVTALLQCCPPGANALTLV